MGKLSYLNDSSEILEFINSINELSCVDIYKNINTIINKLHNSNIYDFDNEFKILSIKSINNLDMRTQLICKCFFDDYFDDCCYSWCNVMSCIDNLSEKEIIIILKNLFSNLQFQDELKDFNIPNNLKFGVELEYSGVSFQELNKLFSSNSISLMMQSLNIPNHLIERITQNSTFENGNEFNKWIFSKEYNDDLPEASSPIMTNTPNDLKEIKTICLLFYALGAKTHGGTGLHINIGTDYFNNNLEALKYLLLIWAECEEIFYKIGNKEDEDMRVCASTMVLPIKSNIQTFFEEKDKILLKNKKDFDRFIYDIQVRDRLKNVLNFTCSHLLFDLYFTKDEEEKYKIFKKYVEETKRGMTNIKFTSINFNHMNWYKTEKGRIEFRIFNSSLDFEIIMQNVLLISKLFETSLELANNSFSKKDKFTELLNDNVSEKDKLNLLLNLLFDNEEEKQIFKQRWISNQNKKSYDKFKVGKDTFISNKNKTLCKKNYS